MDFEVGVAIVTIAAGLGVITSAIAAFLPRLGVALKIGGVDVGYVSPTQSLVDRLMRTSSQLREAASLLRHADIEATALANSVSKLSSERKMLKTFLEADEYKEVRKILRSLGRRPLSVDLAIVVVSIIGSGTLGAILSRALG